MHLEPLARRENVTVAFLNAGMKKGNIVVLKSRKHGVRPVAVGKGLSTKVNANIGTSPDLSSIRLEIKKLEAAVGAGADAVMDLSTGGDTGAIRREILRRSPVPVGTVPIYDVAINLRRKKRPFTAASVDDIFAAIEQHLDEGVDFITVHCGVTRSSIRGMNRSPRICGVVSRGGSMMIEWMAHNRRENPLYEHYDRLLRLAKKYQAALSLGDGLRPGAIADATDRYQVRELVAIAGLVRRARQAGVAAMVEGPGHVPIDEIEKNVLMEKSICGGAPFYVLGPLVTDIGAGYDHVVAAIGGALAAYHGADFLCYVTPAEHLGLPNVEEVREGVTVLRLAAHAADVGKGIKGAREIDRQVSQARFDLNWKKMLKLLIDPEKAQKIFSRRRSRSALTCTMCGEFCAMKKVREVMKG